MEVQVVDDSSFDEIVLNSQLPVLVYFGADWCGPCKTMTPIIKDIQVEFEGKVKIVKADVDKSQETSRWAGIRSVPTFVVFAAGTEVARKTGALPVASMRTLIASSL